MLLLLGHLKHSELGISDDLIKGGLGADVHLEVVAELQHPLGDLVKEL